MTENTGDFVRFPLGTSRYARLAICVAAVTLAICVAIAAPLASPTTNAHDGPTDTKSLAPVTPALGPVTSFPSVGISMAFPADQQPVISTDASCLAVYVRKSDFNRGAAASSGREEAPSGPAGDPPPVGRPAWQSITSFYALKLADDQNDSYKEIAERLMGLHEKQPQYTSANRACAQEFGVQGQKGYLIADTLAGADAKEVAVLCAFPGIHQDGVGEKELRFTHALLVQVRGEDLSAALATAQAILDSVRVGKVQSPADSGLFFQSSVKVRSHGFTIDVPDGWYVRQVKGATGSPIAFFAAITDYIQKDVLTISVTVAAADRSPCIDDAYLADMVAGMKASLAQQKWTPLASHLATLDGQPAAQVMGSHILAENSRTQVSRQAFLNNTSYTITLSYPKDQPVKAWEAMEKLCEGFRFCREESPTSKPAKPAP